ncbi:glycosyl hydrolase [Conyzicola sp.]|uniref:glycosyl hydrolase n=1 Tax=Conyzicola sp. TaxID=1969404 RepID=UPI003989012F
MRARQSRLPLAFLTAAAVAVALSGCMTQPSSPQAAGAGSAGASGDTVFPDAEIASLVAAVPEKTVKALPQARLADGLLPPTNTWFSGLVFGEESMAVFPLPLSFKLSDSGFELGLPTVTATAKNIAGGFMPAVEADVGADSQVVTAYDAASVTIAQYDGDTELGSTVIAQGSPFVSFTAASSLSIPTEFTSSVADGVLTTEVGGTTYGLVSTGDVSGGELTLAAGETATWFALPDDGDLDLFAEAATHPITSTTLGYEVTADSATTTIGYTTADGEPTLIASMPHQRAAGADEGLASYSSIYGTMRVIAGSQLSWSVETLAASGAIDVTTLGADDTARLVAQVAADTASMPAFASDTYYAGKGLARAANLWSLAEQLGAEDSAATLKALIVDELDTWTEADGCEQRTARCFVYDDKAKGIVGLDASYGSDEFNDHHFHYGYFFYAAGMIAADDAELAASWAPVMNLLAADVATTTADESTVFPVQRTFDAYAGHSWASGSSPFADGNNQESSSEAVNAWNGLALWAAASGQESLQTEATWMLSAEAASASAYYTDFDLDEQVYEGYDHTIVSLNWGGKRDWATWFSPEPSAMLGIVLLPLTGVSEYLAGDPERIRSNIADAAPDGYDVLFGDTLLMYSALAGPDDAAAALEQADGLNEDRIDGGNSRSWMLAWLMTHAAA